MIFDSTLYRIYVVVDKKSISKFLAKVFTNDLNAIYELSLIPKLNHLCFLKFIEYSPIDFKKEKKPVIIYESTSNGSLANILELKGKITGWTDTKKLINLYGIASGMEYLHSLNYVHFNLKPENILLDDYLHPKITGLEKAEKTPKEYTPNLYFLVKNRTVYHAPEYSSNENNCSARDVFSFAIIAYHILTNEEPFAGFSAYKITQLFEKEERPEIKNPIPDCYRKLIEKCWVQNPDERPTFEEIVLHLRNNKDFITETIDNEEYENYINYIESHKTKILNSNELLNDFLETQSNTFRKIKIDFNQLRKEPVVHFSINIGSINLNRYSKKTKIGSGAFGNVYTVINKETEEVYAAKVSIYELDQCSDDIIMNLSREVEIMSNINHPSVLRFFGYSPSNFKNKMKPVIVTEYAACGSLDTIIELERNNNGNHEWNDTKKLINLYGIAAGMMYLHKIGIVHRDLKPANILLDEMLYPKIADFGLSKKLKNEKENDNDNDSVVVPSGFKGTYAYCSPEIIFQHKYSFEGDVYAYGMIVYEIMTNEIPFENCNYYQVIDKLYRGFIPEFNHPIPYCYRHLIQKCLSKDSYNRPKFEKIVKMLEKERGFITPNVDEDEYLNYISLIKQSNETKTSTQNQQNKEVIKIELKSIENKELIKNNSNMQRIVETEDEQDNKNTEKNENEIFLKLNNFEREKIINKSYLFKTYEFKDKENGMKYIGQMSMIKIKSFSDENIEYLKDKMSILLKINHPSLLKFIGLSPVDFKRQKKPVIITEYLSNGTLMNILEIERDGKIIEGWNYTKKIIILYGIAAAMLYLHSLDFVHCSLDPENIFLDDLLTPKLRYFGLLKLFFKEDQMSHQSMSGLNNTTVYCSPEVIKNNEYSKASDVYAFAFIMFEILAQEKPFCGKNMNQIINYVIVKRNRPEMNEKIPHGCKNLINKCWSDDPNERPSFGDILNFLKNDKEILNNLEGKDKDDFIKYVKFFNSSEST